MSPESGDLAKSRWAWMGLEAYFIHPSWGIGVDAWGLPVGPGQALFRSVGDRRSDLRFYLKRLCPGIVVTPRSATVGPGAREVPDLELYPQATLCAQSCAAT